ncbi:MAG: TIGR00725 family protein [Candidatus Omnitrophica bacterium]|nr:TIGR00725 family protein [Candidatus Omnitrophota bacterium]
MVKRILISVIGGHKADNKTAKLAYDAGKMIAELNAVLICGGLGGVMEAAARGVKDGGGMTVGILPGKSKEDANNYIDIPIATGLGYTRNTLVAGASDIVIAFAGKEGTLSEIGFALSEKKPIIGLNTWKIPGIIAVKTVEDARKKIVKILGLKI